MSLRIPTFSRPSIITSQLRFILPKNTTASLRLGEIAIHGEMLGGSHPDVFAQRNTAVLFDEGTTDLTTNTLSGSWAYQMTDAFSGSRCLKVSSESSSKFWTIFGPAYPNWYFVVSADPQPGQYRYLRFSWKAISPAVTSMELGLFNSSLVGRGFYCGAEPSIIYGQPGTQLSPTVPQTWSTVTVDLSKYFADGTVVTWPDFNAIGGDALFDRVMLSRTGTFNELPSATLTSPGDGMILSTTSKITISADASDLDGTVNRVEFYLGDRLLGIATTSPYSITETNVTAGTYKLTAKVFDDTGGSATSLPVSITISKP